MIEKPFGHNLESARELNRIVSSVFPASSVFRIDHYLGKETVQNMMALRFANQLFEPVWNNNYVDHVQITMAEDIGIGGRAGYFDGIGIARDVIQNHLLQLLALTAMEEPNSFEASQLRVEKQKVLAAARPPTRMDLYTARGQYAGGWAGGEKVKGYLEEDRIPPDSRTETYAAIRLDIDNRRWAGVPFYLRTGKRLARRVTEIALGFKRAPHLPFSKTDTEELGYNAIVLRIQPDEGVTLRFGAKVPGTQMEIREVNMDFAYGGSFTESSPEAYERLILDVLLGDPPLFPQHEEVELSWEILDPILDYWASLPDQPEPYEPGSWGPKGADRHAGARRLQLEAALMIIALNDTTSAKISAELLRARRSPGSPAQGMVLTLIIVCDESEYANAMEASMAAGREHPSRILLVVTAGGRNASLDAEVHIGEGTPGEVVVIRMRGAVAAHPASVIRPLLLPDSPVVIWWPGKAPNNRAADELAQLAMRRLTDAASSARPLTALKARARDYTPGDTDLSWTRLTPWRALLAAALDQYPAKIKSAARRG